MASGRRIELKAGGGDEAVEDTGTVLQPFEPFADQVGEPVQRPGGQVGQAAFDLRPGTLFTPDAGTDDPLQFADEQVTGAAGSPSFRRIARIGKRNIRAAKIIDPVTGTEIDAESAAASVMVRGLAGMLGEPMPRDAAEEAAAAWGMIDADLYASIASTS